MKKYVMCNGLLLLTEEESGANSTSDVKLQSALRKVLPIQPTKMKAELDTSCTTQKEEE